MQTKLGVQRREYHPKEYGGMICETVIFTNILKHELSTTFLGDLVEAYCIVAIQNKLAVYPSKKGLVCRGNHFERATILLENSIMYN
jgi:hypothetical protein